MAHRRRDDRRGPRGRHRPHARADVVRQAHRDDQRQRPDHGRKRHRQGNPRARDPPLLRRAAQAVHPLQLHAPSRATCSKASCSATAAARSPAPTATTPASSGAARDGTLFLDEIGELSLDLQPKLLRFLESGEICPLGESTPFTVDVRIVAATNANLEQRRQGRPLSRGSVLSANVIRLQIPPLRERRDEIPSLVHHFVAARRRRIRQRPAPLRGRDHGAPAAVPVARQHPAAAQRNPPHGRRSPSPTPCSRRPRCRRTSLAPAPRPAPHRTVSSSPSPLNRQADADARRESSAK